MYTVKNLIKIYYLKSRISCPGWGSYDKNLFRFATDPKDILKTSEIGPEQFINASYVDMEISKNQIDQYILTQGLVRHLENFFENNFKDQQNRL